MSRGGFSFFDVLARVSKVDAEELCKGGFIFVRVCEIN